MTKIAIVSFSGYGHTDRQAEAVHQGAASVAGVEVSHLHLSKEGNLPDGGWDILAASDAIIFGAPTCMGGPAWQFKKFADDSSKPWSQLLWRDKFSTIGYFVTLAMQHSMIWIGTGMMPANAKASQRGDVNWLAGFTGALAQSPSDSSPDEAPHEGDLETARQFAARVATYTVKTRGQ